MLKIRITKVLAEMKANNITQMLVTDPSSIFYLTGIWIYPGERFLALYLSTNKPIKLVANRLFAEAMDIDIEKIWYDDTQDIIKILSNYIDNDISLGIDKIMMAKFLIKLMDNNAALSYKNTSLIIDAIRACKDEEEQDKMRKSSKINHKAMDMITTFAKEGMTELEVAEEIKRIYKELGAEGLSFDSIVAFGENAAIGHHSPSMRKLKKGDCVLIDMGCIKDSYCSDMTRTFFYEETSDKQKLVYEIVQKAQTAAKKAVKPGVQLSEIDKIARDIISDAGYGDNFTHRLGHFIGIDVHEQGDVSSVSQILTKPGMIFSIEPGIYIPNEFGVRIEDLVLVTDNGVEIL